MKQPPSAPVTFKWVHPHVALAELHGDLIASTVPQVRKHLLKLASNNMTLLLVDLAQVRRVDTSGVATFVELLRALNSRGKQLRLAGLNQQVRELIHLTSLDHILDIYASVDRALGAERHNDDAGTKTWSGAAPRVETVNFSNICRRKG